MVNQTVLTHTQHVDTSRQVESDCLITFSSKQESPPFQRSEKPMALANLCVQLTGLMSCICRTMLATIGGTGEQWHTHSMRQLLYEPGCWHTPFVDFPVPQVVEEIAETRNPLIKCNSNLNVYFEEIEVFPT